VSKAEALARRFEEAIQSVLDRPLDEMRVLEWMQLRALREPSGRTLNV
jgi:hypothetical protein